MSAKSGKRPLRSLSAHEKLEAIRRVHDGESKASVARDIGVPESTLRGWCKNEDKISYLSRQSSPDTDESLESQIKKPRLDDMSSQPFNLSTKSSGNILCEPKLDQVKSDNSIKMSLKETPKPTTNLNERERNRAELARLSVELGLNRPELFLPSLNVSASSLADLSTNIGLLAQWNALLMQQQQQQKFQLGPKNMNQSETVNSSTNHTGLLTTVDQEKAKLTIKEKPSVQESVWYWLKSQQSMLSMGQTPSKLPNAVSSTSLTNATGPNVLSLSSNTFAATEAISDSHTSINKWYKQLSSHPTQTSSQECRPILYQQLTRNVEFKQGISPPRNSPESIGDQQNAENLSLHNEKKQTADKLHNSKIRSVLDNLLFNNNNNNSVSIIQTGSKEEVLSQSEAVEHGEKFLRWMEACSDPSVTAMQIMQFRTLLNNIKLGADKKNGELQNKTKGKRK